MIFASCNTLFVEVWTSHKIAWSFTNDLLLGVWMVLLTLVHLHCGFILLTKKIAFMRFIYFAEGCTFVATSLLLLRFGGLPLMIATSVLCSLLFSGAYGTWRVARFFDLRISEVAFDWLKPMFRALGLVVPLALALHFGLSFLDASPRLILTSLILGIWSGFVFGRFGLPVPMRREVLLRTPRFAYPLVQRLFAIS